MATEKTAPVEKKSTVLADALQSLEDSVVVANTKGEALVRAQTALDAAQAEFNSATVAADQARTRLQGMLSDIMPNLGRIRQG